MAPGVGALPRARGTGARDRRTEAMAYGFDEPELELQSPPYKGYSEAVPRPSPLPRLRDLAQDQWGLVTRRQIEAAGIGTTTLERLTAPGGALERVAHGVYLMAGAPSPDPQDLRAGW